jgi:hypothetical protein
MAPRASEFPSTSLFRPPEPPRADDADYPNVEVAFLVPRAACRETTGAVVRQAVERACSNAVPIGAAAAVSIGWCQGPLTGKFRHRRQRLVGAGSSPPPSTLLWPVTEVQQPLGSRRSTPEPDPLQPNARFETRRSRVASSLAEVDDEGEKTAPAKPGLARKFDLPRPVKSAAVATR